jgi:hypothetical protein
MLKRELGLAAVVAAVLTVATAETAYATPECEDECMEYYGYQFFVDDGRSTSMYQLSSCSNNNGTLSCTYTRQPGTAA